MKKRKRQLALLLTACLLAGQGTAEITKLATAAQESKPKYMLGSEHDKQQIVGMCIDIMRAVERVEPSVRFVGDQTFVPFRRIADELATGRRDVFFGMIKTPAREKLYRFVEPPLYPTRNMMAVRIDDPIEIETFDDVRELGPEGVILVANGTAHCDQLEEIGGLWLDTGGRTVEQNINKLLAHRGRFVYSSDKNFESEFENEPSLREHIRILPTVFMVEYQYLATRRDIDPDIFQKLEAAIQQLEAEGTLEEIFQRYVSF